MDLVSSREVELATVSSTLIASAVLITKPPVLRLLVQTAGAIITRTVVAAGVIVGAEQAVTHGTIKQAPDQPAGINNLRLNSLSPLSKVRAEACLVVFSAV